MPDIYLEKIKRTKKTDQSISMVPKTVAAQCAITAGKTNEVKA